VKFILSANKDSPISIEGLDGDYDYSGCDLAAIDLAAMRLAVTIYHTRSQSPANFWTISIDTISQLDHAQGSGGHGRDQRCYPLYSQALFRLSHGLPCFTGYFKRSVDIVAKLLAGLLNTFHKPTNNPKRITNQQF
jgi:hypothetical protein